MKNYVDIWIIEFGCGGGGGNVGGGDDSFLEEVCGN